MEDRNAIDTTNMDAETGHRLLDHLKSDPSGMIHGAAIDQALDLVEAFGADRIERDPYTGGIDFESAILAQAEARWDRI